MHKIEKLDNQELSEIKPLWEQLNTEHKTKSRNFKDHYSRFTFDKRMKSIFEKDHFAVFVARNDSEAIGYVIASCDKNVGEIDSIFVLPSRRRKGLGKELINEAESWLARYDVGKMIISVADGNEVAFPFYEKLGYVPRLTVLQKK